MLRQIFSILILCVFFAGCTNSNPQGRLAVEGEVTLNGRPLAQGSISFDPSGTQGVKTQSGGEIKNGKYTIAAPQGLVAGEYTVRIRSMEEVSGSRKNTGNPIEDQPILKDIIPSEFGSQSVQKITVEKGKQNQFNFQM
ncbi:MAG: hypothetical protein LBT09_14635 [Planctomycetaceae bacterium]|nr:hypothetical protein [Planctomycetaceae bacterium]